ncbi:MAG: hypothetical protein JW723_01225 [Bacteroidales bacterium]|nr:hypothetical protein [Bacteroidales bacterium]
MRRLIDLAIPFVFLALVFKSNAQVAINSPYTRFGLGEISRQGFGMVRGMGGTSIAHRFSNQINYLNPASFSARDTLSFVLDFGVNGEIRVLSTQYEKVKLKDFNMEHVAIAFPVTRWLGTSIGILPYSRIGYNMMLEGPLSSLGDNYRVYHEGNGNLNKFYFGSSVRLGKHLAIGANLSYIFGSYERNKRVSLPLEGSAETRFINETIVGDVMFNFGVQAFTKFKKGDELTLGVTLDNSTELKGEFSSLKINYYPLNVDTMVSIENQKGEISIPVRLGAGMLYSHKNKLIIAIDYVTQDWSKARFFGETDSLTASSSLRFGLQYTPVAITEVKRAPYWQRISFRAGGYYDQTYLDINGKKLEDYGMTFGIGIPWKNERNLLTKTTFNISYQLGWKGTLDNGLVKETYHVLSIGFTFHDLWFIKPKYD